MVFNLKANKAKLSAAFKKYGKLAIITHFSLSAVMFTGFYFALDKFIDSNKYIDDFQKKYPNAPLPSNPTSRNLALAYFLYKTTMIFRLPVTLAAIVAVTRVFNL